MHLALTHDVMHVVFCMPHATLYRVLKLCWLCGECSWAYLGGVFKEKAIHIQCNRKFGASKATNNQIDVSDSGLTQSLSLSIAVLLILHLMRVVCAFMLTKFANHPLKCEWLRKWSSIETYKFWNMQPIYSRLKPFKIITAKFRNHVIFWPLYFSQL